jgi:hypothetical protein
MHGRTRVKNYFGTFWEILKKNLNYFINLKIQIFLLKIKNI